MLRARRAIQCSAGLGQQAAEPLGVVENAVDEGEELAILLDQILTEVRGAIVADGARDILAQALARERLAELPARVCASIEMVECRADLGGEERRDGVREFVPHHVRRLPRRYNGDVIGGHFGQAITIVDADTSAMPPPTPHTLGEDARRGERLSTIDDPDLRGKVVRHQEKHQRESIQGKDHLLGRGLMRRSNDHAFDELALASSIKALTQTGYVDSVHCCTIRCSIMTCRRPKHK